MMMPTLFCAANRKFRSALSTCVNPGRRFAQLGLLTAVCLGVTVSSCASDAKRRSEQDMVVVDKKSDRQYVVEFDGACAMALAAGKIQLGNPKYVMQHDGKTYYFASAAAKQRFEDQIEANITQARQNWIDRGNAV